MSDHCGSHSVERLLGNDDGIYLFDDVLDYVSSHYRFR